MQQGVISFTEEEEIDIDLNGPLQDEPYLGQVVITPPEAPIPARTHRQARDAGYQILKMVVLHRLGDQLVVRCPAKHTILIAYRANMFADSDVRCPICHPMYYDFDDDIGHLQQDAPDRKYFVNACRMFQLKISVPGERIWKTTEWKCRLGHKFSCNYRDLYDRRNKELPVCDTCALDYVKRRYKATPMELHDESNIRDHSRTWTCNRCGHERRGTIYSLTDCDVCEEFLRYRARYR